MKKFIFGVIALIIGALLFGVGWNLNRNKEHSFENYQKELAKREKKIRELDDSIRHLGTKMEIYEITFDALHMIDSATVDKVFHTIWNVREEI